MSLPVTSSMVNVLQVHALIFVMNFHFLIFDNYKMFGLLNKNKTAENIFDFFFSLTVSKIPIVFTFESSFLTDIWS